MRVPCTKLPTLGAALVKLLFSNLGVPLDPLVTRALLAMTVTLVSLESLEVEVQLELTEAWVRPVS